MFGSTFMTDTAPDLIPADKEKGTEGQTYTKVWQLTAPDQARGINQPYTATLKLSYDYKTSAQKLITLVDEAELRRIRDAGESLSMTNAVYSAGPLTVAVTSAPYEKTAAQHFGYDNIFPVQIKITNTGGGVVVPAGVGGGLYGGYYSSSYFGDAVNYPVGIKVTPPSGTSFVSTGGFGGNADCSSGTVTRDMWKGQDVDVTCLLSVNNAPAYKEDRPLTVEVFYRYETEASTPINVYGRDSGYGGFGGYQW